MDNNLSFGRMSPQVGNANTILSQPGMQQVGPSAPTFNPALFPTPQQSMPQAPQMQQFPGSSPVPNSMPQAPQAQLGSSAQPTVGLPPGPSEATLIVKALISRLQNHSKGDAMARGEI